MTKSDCVLLKMNMEAFDSLLEEELKREMESMGKFVHTAIPS